MEHAQIRPPRHRHWRDVMEPVDSGLPHPNKEVPHIRQNQRRCAHAQRVPQSSKVILEHPLRDEQSRDIQLLLVEAMHAHYSHDEGRLRRGNMRSGRVARKGRELNASPLCGKHREAGHSSHLSHGALFRVGHFQARPRLCAMIATGKTAESSILCA